jgi:thiamine monophosphate kinase
LEFAKKYDYSASDLALYGGEEYHLIVSVRPTGFTAVSRALKGKLMPIGVVTREFKGVRLTYAGEEITVARKGWEHFKSQRRRMDDEPRRIET